MAKSYNILFVSSEAYPFAKAGGIGDVAFSLPMALHELGHDVRVMFPKYGNVSERRNKIHEINRLRDIPITVGDATDPATVKSSSMNNPRSKVQAYITTNFKYFDALKAIYNDPKTGLPFPNNDERFIFFSRTVIETCLILNWFPDIIHLNDWHTALVAAYAKIMFPSKFKKTKIVLTIHNFYNQGVYSDKTFAKTGLPQSVKTSFIHKGQFNFLKGGLNYADFITTVSPNYASEIIKDKTYSNDLNKVLKSRSDKFKGILNGIDQWTWTPKTDALIESKFTGDFGDYKEENKKALLEKFNMPKIDGSAIVGFIARLDEQKGISLVLETAEKLFKENIQLVFLCDGEPEPKTKLKNLMKKYPDRISLKFGFDEALAHQIEAGADMYLMPSLYEPCGLNAFFSLAYGTIPIVHEVGGLKNIISDYDSVSKTGNGFSFKEFSGPDLIKTIKRAMKVYKKVADWEKLAMAGINGNYSWEKSAQEYNDIYTYLRSEI